MRLVSVAKTRGYDVVVRVSVRMVVVIILCAILYGAAAAILLAIS